jgi:hypothetical protein
MINDESYWQVRLKMDIMEKRSAGRRNEKTELNIISLLLLHSYQPFLHNAEFHYLYISPGIIRVIKLSGKMGGACGTHERAEKCIKNLAWKA